MNFKKQIFVDESKIEELYMAGLTDVAIGKEVRTTDQYIWDWRFKNDLPSNVGVFSWQSKLKQSELKMIPQKYWNPRFRRAAA